MQTEHSGEPTASNGEPSGQDGESRPGRIDVRKLTGLTMRDASGPHKLTGDVVRDAHGDAMRGRVAVIVKVSEPDYVPSNVKLRARVSPELFTADVDAATLGELERDSRVLSVSTPRPIAPVG